MKLTELIKEMNLSQYTDDGYIYHGTGKGQALNIQKSGHMNPNKTGERLPSISFTAKLKYAEYYAKVKGGVDKMVILRTKITESFEMSDRIKDNKGYEFITFKPIPVSDLEIKTSTNGWQPLEKWDVIFNEPL